MSQFEVCSPTGGEHVNINGVVRAVGEVVELSDADAERFVERGELKAVEVAEDAPAEEVTDTPNDAPATDAPETPAETPEAAQADAPVESAGVAAEGSQPDAPTAPETPETPQA